MEINVPCVLLAQQDKKSEVYYRLALFSSIRLVDPQVRVECPRVLFNSLGFLSMCINKQHRVQIRSERGIFD